MPLSCEFSWAGGGKLTVISCDPRLQMKMPVMTAYFQSAPASVRPPLPGPSTEDKQPVCYCFGCKSVLSSWTFSSTRFAITAYDSACD